VDPVNTGIPAPAQNGARAPHRRATVEAARPKDESHARTKQMGKFAGWEGRYWAKVLDLEGNYRGQRRRTLVWLLASALGVLGTADASAGPRYKLASPHRKKAIEVEYHQHVIEQPAAGDSAAAPLRPDLAAAKHAIELVRRGRAKDATALAASIGDPIAAKLVEWTLLRHSDSEAGFERYVAFIRTNPDWPSMSLLRRRAETRLWQERRDAATVRRFVGKEPTSAIGRLALARVEMETGERAEAEKDVRAVWHSGQLSADLEEAALAAFPDVLAPADHVAPMDQRIGAKDFGAAMRAAKRVGDDQVAIVKACIAAEMKSPKGGKLLDAVRADAREDLGYALCRLHWLLRNETPGSNLHGRIVTPKRTFLLLRSS
jgi:soluble lytic murein transglycosylase